MSTTWLASRFLSHLIFLIQLPCAMRFDGCGFFFIIFSCLWNCLLFFYIFIYEKRQLNVVNSRSWWWRVSPSSFRRKMADRVSFDLVALTWERSWTISPCFYPRRASFRVVVCYSVCNKCVNKDGRSEPYLVCEIIHTWGLFFYDYFRKELLLLPAVYCVHQDNFGKSTELDVVRKHSTSSFSFLHSVLISR